MRKQSRWNYTLVITYREGGKSVRNFETIAEAETAKAGVNIGMTRTIVFGTQTPTSATIYGYWEWRDMEEAK